MKRIDLSELFGPGAEATYDPEGQMGYIMLKPGEPTRYTEPLGDINLDWNDERLVGIEVFL